MDLWLAVLEICLVIYTKIYIANKRNWALWMAATASLFTKYFLNYHYIEKMTENIFKYYQERTHLFYVIAITLA